MYTYATIFMSRAEKAQDWLINNCDHVAVTIKGDYFFIRYNATPEIYEQFTHYMGFIYAR